jgi:uncharacterized protein YhdP
MPLTSQFKLAHTSQGYEFIAEKIFLGNVTQALLWSGELPQQSHQILSDLLPTGDLERVKINWHDHDWQLGLGFAGLNFNAWNDVPGVHNLAGELIASQKAGKISLDSANTRVDYTP